MTLTLEPPPSVSLAYRDKYRLWVDLVRGRTDRLFVPTAARIPLGEAVLINIQLADDADPIEVKGTVIGWRPRSARFRAGIFVRLHQSQLEQCRGFLKLDRLEDLQEHARRNYRVKRNVPVRLIDTPSDAFSAAHNISESGLLLASEVRLKPGQRTTLELHFDDAQLVVDAEVIWTNPERQVAGMQFVGLSAETAEQLAEQLSILYAAVLKSEPSAPSYVVLVDSDDEVMTLVVTSLTQPGCEICHCRRGDEAIDAIWKRRPSLVIMDILVPEIDGARICRMMRADAELAHVPVVLTSPLDTDVLRDVARDCGASDYLPKPFKLADLAGVLASCFEKR